MYDLRQLRDNLDSIRERLGRRGTDVPWDNMKALVEERRNLTMPGLSATVAEEIEALRRFGGEKAVKLIRRIPDENIERIVAGWPSDFDTARASGLGFEADRDFDAIVRSHLEVD